MNKYRRLYTAVGIALPALFTTGTLLAPPTQPRGNDSALTLLNKIQNQNNNDDLGNLIAAAQRQASLIDAESDAFETAARCLNEPGLNVFQCFQQLFKALGEERSLIERQNCARLELNKSLGRGAYYPKIDAKDFSTKITNRFWPLKAGQTLVYEVTGGDEKETIRISRLKDTIKINGIECVQINDVVTIDGELCEDTVDFYAQHKDGSVWYMGEVARNYEDGLLDNLDGSWRYGKDQALPGIIMQANPKTGMVYREEFLSNEAEDVGRVVGLNRTVTVPAGTFRGCVEIIAFTPLEPGIVEHKFYAPGVGMVQEINRKTGERTRLVRIENK